MKIAIIGGSGFIGTVLVRQLLEENHDITILDKRKSDSYPELVNITDIRARDVLSANMAESDCIIHLSAEHTDNVQPNQLYYDVNVVGTENVCRVASDRGIEHIIFTSSVAVYGLNKKEPAENDSLDPYGHYGISKFQAEKILLDWQKEKANRTVTIIRPVVVFGKKNRGNVYNLLKQIHSGHFIPVGNGDNYKSMAYVENVAGFIAWQLNNPPGVHLFNYADKPDLTTRELLTNIYSLMEKPLPRFHIPYWLAKGFASLFDLISKISGITFPISATRIEKFTATTQFSAEKALATDFRPSFSIIEGLKETIEYEFPKPEIKE